MPLGTQPAQFRDPPARRLPCPPAPILKIKKRTRDRGVVDLARSGLTSAGIVSHLNLTDPGQAFVAPADQVAFADLRVIEIQIDAQLRAVNRRHQGQNVFGRSERTTGMVQLVEVFQREDHAFLLGQITNAVQRIARLQPHLAGHDVMLPDWYAAFTQTRSVQIQALYTQPLADLCRLACGFQQHLGAFIIGQSSFHIAVHDGEFRAGGFKLW